MRIRLAVLLAVALVFTACGSGTVDPTSASGAVDTSTTDAPTTSLAAATSTTTKTSSTVAAGFPVTVETAAGTVTVEGRPQAIVSISPTSTEVLFAIGAGSQVRAADDQSNFPSEAPVTDLTGFSSSAESIAAFEPDLVFLSFDPGDLVTGLNALGIPVVVHGAAASLDEAYEQIQQAGVLTGNEDAALMLIGTIRDQIESLASQLPAREEPLTYYHELDNTYYSLTSSTFVGEIYDHFGLVNIADPADADGFGYPQLSEEFIIEQDPDLIFLADTKCCGQNAATVAERPGWNQLTAVQTGRVIELDDDIASRWGPRITVLLAEISAAIEGVPASTG
ncbi:MAG: ABC transporter substrate-binding protein [Acidimicrobiia bacterium]|nr:ABC transporter substrate-binding protein [Acidimicrobiia bacterium]